MLTKERREEIEILQAGWAMRPIGMSIEQIESYAKLFDCAVSELLSELRSVREREYREPREEDEQAVVWVSGSEGNETDWPVFLRWYPSGWRFLPIGGDNSRWTPLNNRLICPVEPKPAVTPKEQP